jgi:uncharacterized protein YqhQ
MGKLGRYLIIFLLSQGNLTNFLMFGLLVVLVVFILVAVELTWILIAYRLSPSAIFSKTAIGLSIVAMYG